LVLYRKSLPTPGLDFHGGFFLSFGNLEFWGEFIIECKIYIVVVKYQKDIKNTTENTLPDVYTLLVFIKQILRSVKM
jgi:hypothetical protein